MIMVAFEFKVPFSLSLPLACSIIVSFLDPNFALALVRVLNHFLIPYPSPLYRSRWRVLVQPPVLLPVLVPVEVAVAVPAQR